MRRAVDNQFGGVAVDELMRVALDATSGTYPHPNPRVGAVIVSRDGTVRSLGVHRHPGQPHAELLALQGLDDVTQDTMIVTLEPCDHHGETPPCTDVIIDSGIKTVIVGTLDPDPRVSGRGMDRLRAAGIEVLDSGLSELVESNDSSYFHHRRTGRPLVTLKLATTLDGQIAALDGTSQWITSPESRNDAHHLRSQNDAIAVGAGTLLADDPLLTVRFDDFRGRQPVPVVFRGRRSIPTDAMIMNRDAIVLATEDHTWVDIGVALDTLGGRGITSLLVEGGATLARSFLDSGAVHRLVIYIGAKLAAGTGAPAIAGSFLTLNDALPITITNVDSLGPDVKITASLGEVA